MAQMLCMHSSCPWPSQQPCRRLLKVSCSIHSSIPAQRLRRCCTAYCSDVLYAAKPPSMSRKHLLKVSSLPAAAIVCVFEKAQLVSHVGALSPDATAMSFPRQESALQDQPQEAVTGSLQKPPRTSEQLRAAQLSTGTKW